MTHQNFLESVLAKNMFFEHLGLFSCFFRACLPAVVFRSDARHFALSLEANRHVVLELFKKKTTFENFPRFFSRPFFSHYLANQPSVFLAEARKMTGG
jgi:hypothetical protein